MLDLEFSSSVKKHTLWGWAATCTLVMLLPFGIACSRLGEVRLPHAADATDVCGCFNVHLRVDGAPLNSTGARQVQVILRCIDSVDFADRKWVRRMLLTDDLCGFWGLRIRQDQSFDWIELAPVIEDMTGAGYILDGFPRVVEVSSKDEQCFFVDPFSGFWRPQESLAHLERHAVDVQLWVRVFDSSSDALKTSKNDQFGRIAYSNVVEMLVPLGTQERVKGVTGAPE